MEIWGGLGLLMIMAMQNDARKSVAVLGAFWLLLGSDRGPHGPKMSDLDSLGIDKIELRVGMGIGTKPHDFNHLEPCKGAGLGAVLVVFWL